LRGAGRVGRGGRAAVARRGGGGTARSGHPPARHERAAPLPHRAGGRPHDAHPAWPRSRPALGRTVKDETMTTPDGPHPWTLSGHAPGDALREQGFALLAPGELAALTGVPAAVLQDWLPQWDRLPPDEYLRDGGRYRFRRHSCFIMETAGGMLTQTPHRPHWQSTDYNSLHGGIDRWFQPLEEALVSDPRWPALLRALGELFTGVAPVDRWYIEAHQFRIDASEGVGRPTPEGAHRDG